MLLENHFFYFTGALTPWLCDQIIKFGQAQPEGLGSVGQINADEMHKSEELQQQVKKSRDSYISWIDEPWVYTEVHPYINQANEQAGWKFDWDFSEPAQFTKYKLNQYYHWHVDADAKPMEGNNPDTKGKIRKLSCTIQLSEPNDYEGGDLEFETPNGKFNVKEIKPKGSICIFPSFVKHRVTPVTSGIRHSLVMWNLGFPFR